MADTAKTAAKPATKPAPAKPADKPAPGLSFAVEAADADVFKTTRTEKPNPLLDAVRGSLSNGKPLQIAYTGDEQAKEIGNLLRRAQRTLECGLSMRTTDTHVVFRASADKRERKYTNEQIREWAVKNGATDDLLFPRIDKTVRDAFKKAHGLVKDKTIVNAK